jgi:hypothetical protein
VLTNTTTLSCDSNCEENKLCSGNCQIKNKNYIGDWFITSCCTTNNCNIIKTSASVDNLAINLNSSKYIFLIIALVLSSLIVEN